MCENIQYERNQIIDKLVQCFSGAGIIVDDDYESPLDYGSSMTFMSLLVRIESQFDIEISDEYLAEDKLLTFSDYIGMVEAEVEGDKAKAEKDVNEHQSDEVNMPDASDYAI